MKNTGLIVGIVAGVGALCTAAFFIFKKKKDSTTGDDTSSGDAPTYEPPVPDETPPEEQLGINTSTPSSPSYSITTTTGNTTTPSNTTTNTTTTPTVQTLNDTQKDLFTKQMKYMLDMQVYLQDPIASKSTDVRLMDASEKVDKNKLKNWGITNITNNGVNALALKYRKDIVAGVSQTADQKGRFIKDMNLQLAVQSKTDKKIAPKERIKLAAFELLRKYNTQNVDYEKLKDYGLQRLIAFPQIYLIAYNFEKVLNF
jgi:hypothetical protein